VNLFIGGEAANNRGSEESVACAEAAAMAKQCRAIPKRAS